VAAAKEILFEQNNPESYQRFKNRVNPILERIRQDQGISRFAVIMDSSTTTGADIDRGIVRGKIFLEPVRSAEFIDIDFVITATGVTFAS
jgi:phage tail sheath protein FI